MLIFCPDRYKIQKMCDETVVYFLQVKYLQCSIILYLLIMTYSFLMRIFVVMFFATEMGILGVNVDKTNLDDNKNLFEDHPDINHVKKTCKELKTVAWHSTRWWKWCLPEDEKKGKELIFTDKVGKCQKCF